MKAAARKKSGLTVSKRAPDLLFLLLIVLLALTGLVSYEHVRSIYYRYNLLPASAIFDLSILTYVLLALRSRISRACAVIAALCAAFLVVSMILLPQGRGGSPTVMDIVVAYKPFFYLIILCFVRPGKLNISIDSLEQVFKILLFAFLVKYLLAKSVFGIPRPGLFFENNFELVLLTVLFVYLSRTGRLGSNLWIFMLMFVIVLSESRAGLLALIAALMTSSRNFSTGALVAIIVVPTFLLAVLMFLNTRTLDLSQTDRFEFMLVFLGEVRDFTIWNYFLGTSPMTPLSDASCNALSFYTALFSSGDRNTCYSVIFHVFYFRMIFDHGILGLLFLIYGFYAAMRALGLTRGLAFALMLQGMINGVSISGLGNTYFVLGVVLILSAQAYINRHVDAPATA